MFDRNTEMDMTEGPLFKKLVAYAIPIMLTGILQLLFNAADLIVVGRFAGRTALAAVEIGRASCGERVCLYV